MMEKAASRVPKYSKLVQVEFVSPRTSNRSREVQCSLLLENEGSNVKVQTMPLEDRGVQTDELVEHHVETFVFKADKLPLLRDVRDAEEDVANTVEVEVEGDASSPASSSGRMSGPTLSREASEDVAALCARASEELVLHRRLLQKQREKCPREECEDAAQTIIETINCASATEPEVKPKLVNVSRCFTDIYLVMKLF